MINEEDRYREYHPRSRYYHIWINRHASLDPSGIVWADSSGYVGNLFLLWMALVLANGTWDLVARSISEMDAQIHNVT